ncbi:MAG: hypothetical protein ACYTFY_17585 [Planctomycetota bacterium]
MTFLTGRKQPAEGKQPFSLEHLKTVRVLLNVDEGLKMIADRIVEEVRNVREAHAKKLNFDISAIAKDTKEQEEELKQSGWDLKIVNRAKISH